MRTFVFHMSNSILYLGVINFEDRCPSFHELNVSLHDKQH